MNTDIAELITVLRSLLQAARAGKMSKPDYQLCEALLDALSVRYRAGLAAIASEAVEIIQT